MDTAEIHLRRMAGAPRASSSSARETSAREDVAPVRFEVYGLRFTVYGLRFTVYGLRFTVPRVSGFRVQVTSVRDEGCVGVSGGV